jgi:hypothetical protein
MGKFNEMDCTHIHIITHAHRDTHITISDEGKINKLSLELPVPVAARSKAYVLAALLLGSWVRIPLSNLIQIHQSVQK